MFTIMRKNYLLTKYSPGEYNVPEIKVSYSSDGGNKWKDIVIPEVLINVKTVLPEGFKAGPAKIRIGGSLSQPEASPFSKNGLSDGDFSLISGPIRLKILEKEKIRYPVDNKELAIKIAIFLCSGFLAAVFIFLIRKVKDKLSRRELPPLDQALASLAQLEKRECSVTSLITELSMLLRRSALCAFPEENCAALSGESWLEFLDRQLTEKSFTTGVGRCLADGPYQPTVEVDRQSFTGLVLLFCGRMA